MMAEQCDQYSLAVQNVVDLDSKTTESKEMASPDEPLLCYTSSFHPPGVHDNVHLQPLTFPERTVDIPSCFISEEFDFPIYCFVCSAVFTSERLSTTSDLSPSITTSDPSPLVGLSPREKWLRHLLIEHKIVVHNVHQLASLKHYSEYWRDRLGKVPLEEVVPVIRTNTDSDQFTSEDYYLFSSTVPEEKHLRQDLHRRKLVVLLEVQRREREDTSFTQHCLFCSLVARGNRRELFQHMLDSHGFNVGQPDNLVFVKEFLALLQSKLDSLQCLYCERTFRDRVTLKDHMRKKGHKKINAANKGYDKFYMINHLELGRNWEQQEGEGDKTSEESEWTEDPAPLSEDIHCLFCLCCHDNMDATLSHMTSDHGFDLCTLRTELCLNYYSSVRLVNYIRRKVHSSVCIYCGEQFSTLQLLLCHMTDHTHFRLPSNRAIWDQPQYLFPTYENDSFLCHLDNELM